jgi:hypothetical protein
VDSTFTACRQRRRRAARTQRTESRGHAVADRRAACCWPSIKIPNEDTRKHVWTTAGSHNRFVRGARGARRVPYWSRGVCVASCGGGFAWDARQLAFHVHCSRGSSLAPGGVAWSDRPGWRSSVSSPRLVSPNESFCYSVVCARAISRSHRIPCRLSCRNQNSID